MELGVPLYRRDGYRIYAVSANGAGSAEVVTYIVTTGEDSIVRIESAFDDARRWLDALVDSKVARGVPRLRSGATRNHR